MLLNLAGLPVLAVGIEFGSGAVADKGAGHIFIRNGIRPRENFKPRCFADQLPVSGVHVDGRRQSGIDGPLDVGVKTRPVDRVVIEYREKDRGDAGNFSAGCDERRRVDRLHKEVRGARSSFFTAQ